MMTADGTMISDKIAIFVIAFIGLTLIIYLVWHEIHGYKRKKGKDEDL